MNRYLAKLGKCDIGVEDHGILTIGLSANMEDSGCGGFGTICGLSFGRSDWKSDVKDKNYLGTYISGLLEAVGVRYISEIEGRYVFMLSEKDMSKGWGHSSSEFCGIQGMKDTGGHVFNFDEWQTALKGDEDGKKN
jgi:hypothetical protein